MVQLDIYSFLRDRPHGGRHRFAAVLALAGCATNRAGVSADYSNLSGPQVQTSVAELSARHRPIRATSWSPSITRRPCGPRHRTIQAASVMERLVAHTGRSRSQSRLCQGIVPPRGGSSRARRDRQRHQPRLVPTGRPFPFVARALIRWVSIPQPGKTMSRRCCAPHQASACQSWTVLRHDQRIGQPPKRIARSRSTARRNQPVRQNLALVIGLQGRFDESRQLYSREFDPSTWKPTWTISAPC